MSTVCDCEECQLAKGKLQLMKNKCTQPCFGFFLQGSAKETAIANSFVALASMIIFAAGIGEYLQRFHKEDEPSVFLRCIRPVFWVVYYLYWSLEIYLSILLYQASTRRDRQGCLKWMVIQIICYVIWLILFINHSYVLFHVLFNPILQACFWVISIYKLYTFWVIKSFIDQIHAFGSFDFALRKLDDEDVEAFEQGRKWSIDPRHRPYDRDFEVSLEHLNDRSLWVEIGSGEFGTAYKATYSKDGVSVYVAIKTVHCTDNMYFKAMLSELKIMTFIGQHPNIVNLIGACTDRIRERKLDLIVELCVYGNLLSFLQTRRGLFVNQIDEEGQWLGGQGNVEEIDRVTITDLVRWSLDTARGMEYLHTKGVVHGDIAARNVLLTMDKVAKISDFGLSRRIYSHKKNYVRDTTAKMLPWKWLAPEAFSTHLRFSNYTDVWSYGITLYEFFTLGEPPYPFLLDFDREFIVQLKSGAIIMDRPHYCPLNVYKIMQKCWKLRPEERSQFTQIIPMLEKVLQKFNTPDDIEPRDGSNGLNTGGSLSGDSEADGEIPGSIPAPGGQPYTLIVPSSWRDLHGECQHCRFVGHVQSEGQPENTGPGQLTLMVTSDKCQCSIERNVIPTQLIVPASLAPYVTLHV